MRHVCSLNPLVPVVLALGLAACGSKDDDAPLPTESDTPPAPSDTSTYVPDVPVEQPPVVDYCPPLAEPPGGATQVTASDDLQAAIDAAAPGTTLVLAPGTYALKAGGITIITEGLTLRGAGNDRSAVVLDGGKLTGNAVTIAASDVVLAGLTIANARNHGVEVRPDPTSISGVQLTHVHIVDPGENGVMIDAGAGLYADGGSITCTTLELTDAGRDEVIGDCETGGIEGVEAQGWTVSDNEVRGFWCVDERAEPAISFTRGSRDTTLLRNRVYDSPLGIALGVGDSLRRRTYADDPCGGVDAQHFGGLLVNNMVWAGGRGITASAAGIEAGIAIDDTCEARVFHNTTYAGVTPEAGIRHDGALTSGILANNLASGTIRRGGSTMEVDSNVENAPRGEFVDPVGGDLHLGPATSAAPDEGTNAYVAEVSLDIDGQPRDDGRPDVGADEIFR